MKDLSTTITFSLSEKDKQKLDKIAAINKMTLSNYISSLITESMKDVNENRK